MLINLLISRSWGPQIFAHYTLLWNGVSKHNAAERDDWYT